MSFLASEFGLSVNRDSDRFIGWLRMSQINALMEGYSKLKQKEADAVKSSSGGASRFEANTIGELMHIPGVVVKNRKK